MYKPRKVTALLLSIVLVLSFVLAGCAKNNNNESGAANNEKGPTKEKVTINFWANKFEDTTSAWFKRWTDEFNKTHDDVQVKLTIVPGETWDQKLKAAQAAGTAPDITTMSYGNIAQAAKDGKITALDEYIDPGVISDLYENIEKFVNVKGKHYAYPMLVEPSAVLYYRKDLFTAAGLDPEKPPTTWDELIADGKKLTKKGVYGIKVAGNAAEYAWTTYGMQMQSGHRLISDDWSKSLVMDDKLKNLVAFYKRLYDEKVVPKQALKGYTDGADFGEGKEAMAITGSWVIGQLRNDYKDIVDKVGVAPIPTPDGNPNQVTATLGGWSLAVDGKSKHPKEAAEYVTWLLGGDPSIMVDFFKTSKFSKFAPRKSVDEALKSDPDAQNDPWRKIVAEQIVPYSVAEPSYPWEISFAFGSAIENAIKGKSVDASLKQADKDIKALIENKKLAGTNPQQ